LLSDEHVLCDAGQSSFGEIAALFGKESNAAQGCTAEEYNSHFQVFPSEEWDGFLAGIKAQRQAGGPAAYLHRSKCLPNAFMNIRGGFDVSFLLFVNSTCPQWEDA